MEKPKRLYFELFQAKRSELHPQCRPQEWTDGGESLTGVVGFRSVIIFTLISEMQMGAAEFYVYGIRAYREIHPGICDGN